MNKVIQSEPVHRYREIEHHPMCPIRERLARLPDPPESPDDPLPVRHCEQCGAEMQRHQVGVSRLEQRSKYMRRRFCNQQCYYQARREGKS
jgi:hypothetical protein